MPELPEVETIRRQLSSVLIGLKIKSVEAKVKRVFPGNERLIVGKTIKSLRRYSKALVIDLSSGLSLVIHLKMTGRLVYQNFKSQNSMTNQKNVWDIDYPSDKHTHVIINFTDDSHLYFNDVRKFGWMQLIKTTDVEKIPYIAKLGPEFLNNLTIQQFSNVLKDSHNSVKQVLMDQEKLAGVGNIYANESLWCARINPKTKANKLLNGQIIKLFNCLETILAQAIKWQGASDNNYRDAFGEKGQAQEHFNVYNRLDHPCPRCKTPIKRIVLGGRGTFFCPVCQPL